MSVPRAGSVAQVALPAGCRHHGRCTSEGPPSVPTTHPCAWKFAFSSLFTALPSFCAQEIRLVLSLPLPGRPLHSPRHPRTSKLPQSHGSGAWEPRTVRQPRPCSCSAGGSLCPRTSISLETAQTHLCGTSPTGSSPARSHCEKRIVLLPPGIPVSPPGTLP